MQRHAGTPNSCLHCSTHPMHQSSLIMHLQNKGIETAWHATSLAPLSIMLNMRTLDFSCVFDFCEIKIKKSYAPILVTCKRTLCWVYDMPHCSDCSQICSHSLYFGWVFFWDLSKDLSNHITVLNMHRKMSLGKKTIYC